MSIRGDLTARVNHLERLPDSVLLLVLNSIGDVKVLGRCCVVSRRFRSLVPQVENVLVRVDRVISDDGEDSSSASGSSSSPLAGLCRTVFTNIFKPLHALGQFLSPRRSSSVEPSQGGGVSHHSPTQVLNNFDEIKILRIELPSAELGIDDGVLLKWRANFGSTLDNCVILGANSSQIAVPGEIYDNGSIPESLYTNGGLKLRVVWSISSLIGASARHYLLQPIIAKHQTLNSLVLTDADEQGVLCMNREQLEEMRVKPLWALHGSKRTMVPALNMRLWYAPLLELPGGVVLKGATLIAIHPSQDSGPDDLSWVAGAFEGPYGVAAMMLLKTKTYSLEMNSF
ncbi:LOW QUALITY PROTEIN: uncharacterized protein [Phyllobates terribilis]|uniref:LOW QUALITY PROTEIN: uncharacterized protein n=1 Tax=Phyllobates terribilis TaxID=111132 RepID=UPI003CCAC18E